MKLHQKMDSHHKKEKKGLTRGWRQASDVRSTPPDDLTSDATTKENRCRFRKKCLRRNNFLSIISTIIISVYLLWTTDKTRDKENTYKWVSVQWKTKVKTDSVGRSRVRSKTEKVGLYRVFHFQPNKKRRNPRDGDVTLELWWIRKLI